MVVKVYINGAISDNREVKKRQQRVLVILDSKNINYQVVDIGEPGSEEEKHFMQTYCTSNGATMSDPNPRHPLPPQLFNDDVYCGDYDAFDMANELNEMEKFLKLQATEVAANVLQSISEIKLKSELAEKYASNVDMKEKKSDVKEKTASNADIKPRKTEVSGNAISNTDMKVNMSEVSGYSISNADAKVKKSEIVANVKSNEDINVKRSEAAGNILSNAGIKVKSDIVYDKMVEKDEGKETVSNIEEEAVSLVEKMAEEKVEKPENKVPEGNEASVENEALSETASKEAEE